MLERNRYKAEFWQYLERLAATSPIRIDRPRGSRHPRYPELIYPLDYGYLEGTLAQDGGGMDLFLGSRSELTIEAIALSVDLDKKDTEIKLLIACTVEEEQVAENFLNGAGMRAILIRRQPETFSVMKNRRSVRSFTPEPIPTAVLDQILTAATWAPSAHNRQPWRFAVLVGTEVKLKLAEGMGAEFRRDLIADGVPGSEIERRVERSMDRILSAGAAILVCLDTEQLDLYPDSSRRSAEYLMGVQSVAMAGQNLLLAAHVLGLGAVWMCAPLFAGEAVRTILELPQNWDAMGLVLLGYARQESLPTPRLSVNEVTRFYPWGGQDSGITDWSSLNSGF